MPVPLRPSFAWKPMRQQRRENDSLSRDVSARIQPLLFAWGVLAISAMLFVSPAAAACPACGPVLTRTLSERYTQADVAVLTQWVEASRGDSKQEGFTQFETIEVARRRNGPEFKKGEQIRIPRHQAGQAGDLFLLLGTLKKDRSLDWEPPLRVSEVSYQYIRQAPAPETASGKRLRFFLKFFEMSDPMIADDAYAEFAKSPYQDVAALAKEFSREKLRQWLVSPQTTQTRIGLYGLLLGLCGTKDDLPLLEKKIVETSNDYRLGIDGVIAGYLMISGEKGLALVEESKLKNKQAPLNETFDAAAALRILWTYGDGRIGRERLRISMRLLLDRPALTEIVITDLARWKDWEIQDRLMEMYGKQEFQDPKIREAIAKFLIVSTRDIPRSNEGNPTSDKLPPHVIRGQKLLAEIRQRDPKIVRAAERALF